MRPERKNKMLAMTLIFLSAVLIAVVFVSFEPSVRFDQDLFKVENPDEIDHITLESAKGKIDLRYQPSGWVVNEKYAADADLIRVLFATLMQNEPRQPVAARIRDSLSADLMRNGVHVTVRAGETIVRSFYAGGNSTKTRAYFMEGGGGDVYLMTIPGYRVYVSGVYELDENGFRNKFVFSFDWKNFTSLKTYFPSKPSENFTVSLQKNFFTIDGMQADTARLNTFLNDVSLLTVESYANPGAFDTIPQPLMEIVVTDVASRHYRLKIFNPEKSAQVPGLVGKEPAYFLPERIRPVLRPKSFFTVVNK